MSFNACANCVFCKIIAGSLPARKLAETPLSVAFLDINPLSRGHCLVIPKQHAERFPELTPESVVDMSLLMHKVAKAIDPNGDQAFNILNNNGKLAHQVVMHVHFHLIPKHVAQDGLAMRWHQLEMSDDELKAVAKQLQKTIARNEATLMAEMAEGKKQLADEEAEIAAKKKHSGENAEQKK